MMANRVADYERIKQAQIQRKQQLKDWIAYDQSFENETLEINQAVRFPNEVVLMECAQKNDVKEAKKLLELGIDPNTKNEDGLTVLHQACINNNYGIAKLLLSYDADVNATDAELWTPLHAAATCGFDKICQLLVNNGADLLAINIDGNMPYDICDDEKTLDLIESEMGKKNVTQEQIDNTRKVPELKMLDDMVAMYKNKKDLNEIDERGAAMIHVAASLGYDEVTKFLLQCGIDPDKRDSFGSTAAHIATTWGHWEVLELLVMFGADLDLENNDDKTVFTIWDDEETTEKIRELWSRRDQLREYSKHLEKLGFKHSRSFNQRRSFSSVRRSSVKQKSNLSRREAKEEALMNPTNMKPENIYEPDSVQNDISHLNSPKTAENTITSPLGTIGRIPSPISIPNKNGSHYRSNHENLSQPNPSPNNNFSNNPISSRPKTPISSSSPETIYSPISVEHSNLADDVRIPVTVDLNTIQNLNNDSVHHFKGALGTIGESEYRKNTDAFEHTSMFGRNKPRNYKTCCCII